MTDYLITETRALADLAAEADPSTPIPTCPGWTMQDLLGHVGTSHFWTAEVVTAGVPGPPHTPPAKATAGWLVESTGALVDALRLTPHPEVWTFLGPKPPAFWGRRIRNDLVVHHADAALALGLPFTPAPEVAADVISEGLELIAAGSQTRTTPDLAALAGSGEVLRFAADEGPSWRVVRSPSGITWSQEAGGAADMATTGLQADATAASPADVTVAAPLTELLFVFTRRLPLARAAVTGDHSLAEHWRRHTAFG